MLGTLQARRIIRVDLETEATNPRREYIPNFVSPSIVSEDTGQVQLNGINRFSTYDDLLHFLTVLHGAIDFQGHKPCVSWGRLEHTTNAHESTMLPL